MAPIAAVNRILQGRINFCMGNCKFKIFNFIPVMGVSL